MPALILSTKLSIPPLRSRLVTRPQLIQRLNQGLNCGFILVSAPAGYGKSTLISSWLSRLEFPATWISLDDSDNDLLRFLTYLVAALQAINPTIEADFQSSLSFDAQVEVESLLVPLINQLVNINQSFCLVLDDYHAIQNQVVHQAVSFLLEHRPAALHLIIVTRADPPLPLARMRVRSEMVEIRMADLRFSTQEAADFLDNTMELTVSPEDVALLTLRTEGWIAGLQMAALSMKHSDDISGFISTLTGSHHYIFDYLIDEILNQQPDEIRRFLLYTSVLDQLSSPLCDALLEGDAETPPSRPSSVILDELEHANLFIIPLDHEQRWYRYHPLFAELLRGYLIQTHPGKSSVLHSRASAKFEELGMISDAIRHAFAASDWERIIILISANIFSLLEQNELTFVERQLENLTSEKSIAYPWLLIGRAWLAGYTGKLSAVEPILKLAEGEIDGLNCEADLQKLGGHIAMIRAYINWIGDKRDLAEKAARAALDWLPETEQLLRCQAATLLGLVTSDFKQQSRFFEQALAYARKCSVSHVTIFAHGCWAWYLTRQARLREAQAACFEAIQLANSSISHQTLPTLSHVYSTLSSVLCEWNDFDAAIRYSKEAVNLARHWEQADALHFALDNLGYALFASGDVDGAFDVAHQAWLVARNTSIWFEKITIAQEVEWYLALDNLEAALQCFHRANIDIEESSRLPLDAFNSLIMPLSIIQIFIFQKQYSKAMPLIEALIREMENKGYIHFLINVLTWQALAYYGLKQETQALTAFKRALTLAEPGGYANTFIRKGPGLIPLLQLASSAGIAPIYVDTLLKSLESGGKQHYTEKYLSPQLVEPLSRREMEVLKLLGQGYADKKIAEVLVIARETVHKHLKNIYGKLDVHSRSEAIVRARELGLL